MLEGQMYFTSKLLALSLASSRKSFKPYFIGLYYLSALKASIFSILFITIEKQTFVQGVKFVSPFFYFAISQNVQQQNVPASQQNK